MAYVDWIKIEHTTPDKQEICRIAEILNIDHDAVFGKVMRFWIWADQNTEDGNLNVTTSGYIDRITSCTGFADALINVGWLARSDTGLVIPNFDYHMSESAKKRANNVKKVRKHRKVKPECNQNVTKMKPDDGGVLVTPSSSTSTSSYLDIDSNNLNNNEDENENYARPGIQPIEEWLSDFPEEVRKPAVQAAIAYQTRRYGGPNPGASWYRELLREAASVLEVQPNLQDSLERFKTACLAKPTPALSRQATFSDIAISIGIKKPRAPNGEPALKTKDELIAYFAEGMKV